MDSHHEIVIRTYDDLRKFLQGFRKGIFDLLVIISAGGLGKTYNARRILGNSVHHINCHITPLGLYEQGFIYRNKDLWFDDVENTFNNDKLIGLLKQFCETLPQKEIQYLTSWNIDHTRKIPKGYFTQSKVLMTVNSLTRSKNQGVLALLDRGLMVHFIPSTGEIVDYVQQNFPDYDKEVLHFLQDKAFSLRDYLKAFQLKNAGFDWQGLMSQLLTSHKNEPVVSVPKTIIGRGLTKPEHAVKLADEKNIAFTEAFRELYDRTPTFNERRYARKKGLVLKPMKPGIKPILCPECHSDRIAKYGFRHNMNREVQKYQCKECGKKFSEGSRFQKISPEMVEWIKEKRGGGVEAGGMSYRELVLAIKEKYDVLVTHPSIVRALAMYEKKSIPGPIKILEPENKWHKPENDDEVKLGHDEILCGYCLQNKIPKGQVACVACQAGFEKLKRIA